MLFLFFNSGFGEIRLLNREGIIMNFKRAKCYGLNRGMVKNSLKNGGLFSQESRNRLFASLRSQNMVRPFFVNQKDKHSLYPLLVLVFPPEKSTKDPLVFIFATSIFIFYASRTLVSVLSILPPLRRKSFFFGGKNCSRRNLNYYYA